MGPDQTRMAQIWVRTTVVSWDFCFTYRVDTLVECCSSIEHHAGDGGAAHDVVVLCMYKTRPSTHQSRKGCDWICRILASFTYSLGNYTQIILTQYC